MCACQWAYLISRVSLGSLTPRPRSGPPPPAPHIWHCYAPSPHSRFLFLGLCCGLLDIPHYFSCISYVHMVMFCVKWALSSRVSVSHMVDIAKGGGFNPYLRLEEYFCLVDFNIAASEQGVSVRLWNLLFQIESVSMLCIILNSAWPI